LGTKHKKQKAAHGEPRTACLLIHPERTVKPVLPNRRPEQAFEALKALLHKNVPDPEPNTGFGRSGVFL
jgi:hypothetical protein